MFPFNLKFAVLHFIIQLFFYSDPLYLSLANGATIFCANKCARDSVFLAFVSGFGFEKRLSIQMCFALLRCVAYF